MNRYKQYALILVGMSLICLIHSCSYNHQRYPSEYYGWGKYDGGNFSVRIPNNVHVHRDEKVDFYIYSFTITDAEKKELLFSYEGHHPDFGQFTPKEHFVIQDTEINGLKAYSIQWKDKANLFHCEIAVHLPPTSFVHFWYFGLSKEDKNIADNIIQSLEPGER